MLKIERNASLKQYTTFGIDVQASYLVFVHNREEIQELIKSDIYQNTAKRLILGSGSNILLTENFDGLLIINRLTGKQLLSEDKGKGLIFSISSGENRNDLVLWAAERNYVGIENLVAIPGTVGAAPVQNIGAYGVEVSQVIERVRGINMTSGEEKKYDKEDCEFGYRTSIFKTTLKEDFFITSVIIKLSKSTRNNYQPILTYGGITEALEQQGHTNRSDPTWIHTNARALANTISHIRASKLPNRKELGTAGSFFANPMIDTSLYEQLQTQFPDLVGYPTTIPGATKMSAGQLIELCGLKGYRNGDAGVYEKHALVLVNHGNASGKEMKALVNHIQSEVHKKFGIDLVPEVNII